MALFRFQIPSPNLVFALEIDRGRLGEGKGDLSAFREIEPIPSGIAADLRDEFLALCSGGAAAVIAHNAMDALAVDHNVDAVSGVAVCPSLRCDALLGDLLAGLKLADRGTGQAGVAASHGIISPPSFRTPP